jgi:hypothetical protein
MILLVLQMFKSVVRNPLVSIVVIGKKKRRSD